MHQLFVSQDTSDLELLRAAVAGSENAAEDLKSRYDKYLRGVARRHAPTLSSELHSDVVQEAWLALYRRPIPHKLQDARFKTYMAGLIRDGIKVVWANNRPPGLPSRMRRSGAQAANSRHIVRIDLKNAPEPIDPKSTDLIDLSVDIERLARRAPGRKVAEAIRLMATQQLTRAEAAAAVGLSRQTLSRRLLALTEAA